MAPWLSEVFEVGYTYGWREGELLHLKVNQVDLFNRVLRLNPGETKIDEGRIVQMTNTVYAILSQCVVGKTAGKLVFTREDGIGIQDFRKAWWKVCTRVCLGHLTCTQCDDEANVYRTKCGRCGGKQLKYVGLLFHDLRRTAIPNMTRRDIPENLAMKISGHKTRAVFDRYNIVSEPDLKDAARKIERGAAKAHSRYRLKAIPTFGHSLGIVAPNGVQNETAANKRKLLYNILVVPKVGL